MATKDSTDMARGPNPAGFEISEGPVIRHGAAELGEIDFDELPRAYGEPILFAMPRDPRTLFTYWSVGWSSLFAKAAPLNRKVYLRVKKADGVTESELVIEPMLGTYYPPVAKPRETYQVELGYYQLDGSWNSVAISDPVTMPPESASENASVDVATVPFHLSFQRMIDLFRASNGKALTNILSRLQSKALTEEERALLSPEEWEILRAMNLSLSEIGSARRAFAERVDNGVLRKRTEAILGFGSTSPSAGFGASSWSQPPPR